MPFGSDSLRDEGREEPGDTTTCEHGSLAGERPLAIHADLRVGQDEPQLRATLCRCGASSSKPYCDNSHAKVAFAATGEPATKESEPLSTRSGPLVIEPVPNGPLHLSGPAELISGTGRTINRTTETWLCRCGHSANKPYCDGTHKKVGFQA